MKLRTALKVHATGYHFCTVCEEAICRNQLLVTEGNVMLFAV